MNMRRGGWPTEIMFVFRRLCSLSAVKTATESVFCIWWANCLKWCGGLQAKMFSQGSTSILGTFWNKAWGRVLQTNVEMKSDAWTGTFFACKTGHKQNNLSVSSPSSLTLQASTSQTLFMPETNTSQANRRYTLSTVQGFHWNACVQILLLRHLLW